MKPIVYIAIGAIAATALFLAYSAGQKNFGAEMEETVQSELERLRSENILSVQGLRTELSVRAKELEESFYILREELARSGVDLGPLMPKEKKDAVPEEAPLAPISREVFAQLADEMPYAQVVDILDRNGTLTFKIEDVDGTLTQNYRWTWKNEKGDTASISASFINGELTSRRYKG